METVIQKDILFFNSLGKLFCAIAMTRGTIKNEEFSKLQLYVLNYWLELDDMENYFGVDAAYLIELVFEKVEVYGSNSRDMYTDFIMYYHQQRHLFTPEVNGFILQTSRVITHTFSGVYTSERLHIDKLEIELLK